MYRLVCSGVVLAWLGFVASAQAEGRSTADLIDEWMTGSHRDSGNSDRNQYRHPKETLSFFELDTSMTVVEIWPSRGWYTEILAPVLRNTGKYYAAGFALTAKRTPEWRKKMQREFQKKLDARPEIYDQVIVTELSVPERTEMAPPGTADMVLTFRNVHNWMKGDYAAEMFEAMFKALKSGGVLGVVEHRAKKGTSHEQMVASGYVTEAHVKTLAKAAGFRFVASSKINANPKDTTDHPAGVWTLPPTLRLGAKGRDTYLGIGESDRMTLKFIKPKTTRSKRTRN